jgi:hypothetical protein
MTTLTTWLNASLMLSTAMSLLMSVQLLLEQIHLMNVLKVLKKGADISILHKAYESNIP